VLAKDANGYEDWPAVDEAMKARMLQRGMSVAQLARETGLSETTIRSVGKDGSGTESPLVAIAAVLDWPLDWLRSILHGEPEKNAQEPAETPDSSESVIEPRFKKLLRTELGPVKKDVAALRDIVDRDVAALRGIVDRIDQKIDRIIQDRPAGTDGPV
jgi:lambda repressor-like predicted transcriptional regulator